MLFLLLAWKRPPMTSALYPYVHTRACGMSTARYSSGQKTVGSDRDDDDDDDDDDAGLEAGPCACFVSVAEDRPVRRLNKKLSPLDSFVTSLLPWLAPAVVSQVP
jgi:hypothetical protein